MTLAICVPRVTLALALAPSGLLIEDDFNRADTTSGEGLGFASKDGVVSTYRWVTDNFDGTYNPLFQAGRISGNQYLTTSNEPTVIDSGISDGTASVTFLGGGNTYATANNFSGIFFRAQPRTNPDSNYFQGWWARRTYMTRMTPAASGSGGSEEQFFYPNNVIFADGDRMRVSFDGPTIRVFKNSEQVLSIDDPAYMGNTAHGLAGQTAVDAVRGTPNRFEDFEIRDSVDVANDTLDDAYLLNPPPRQSSGTTEIINTLGYRRYSGPVVARDQKTAIWYFILTDTRAVVLDSAGSTGDTYLTLLDEAGQYGTGSGISSTSDDANGTDDGRIAVTLDPGKYYILACGYSGAISDIRINYSGF